MTSTSSMKEDRRPPGRRRRLVAGLAFVVAVVFPLAVSAPARADAPDPVGSLVGAVQQSVDAAVAPVSQVASKPSPKPSPTTQHAGSSTAEVTTHHAPVAEVSGNHVGTQGSGKPRGKATLLGVGGTTVIGSHADSGHSAHSPVPANPLCARSAGALCLDLLYADSSATETSATTATGLAAVCVGGDDPTGASCSGQHLAVAPGSAHEDEHGSSSSAGAATACLRVGPACDVDADALSSASGSGTDQPDLLGITLGGTRFELPRDTAHVDVPTGCEPAGLACVVLNALTAGPEGQAKHAAGIDAGNDAAGITTGSSSSDEPVAPAGTAPVDPANAASAQLVDLGTAGHQLVDVSHNAASDDDQHAAADGTLLSVAGVELIGSHASSDGSHSEGPIPSNVLGEQVGHPLCEASGGSLCADLLYADATASHSPDSADAASRTGLAALCLGGDDPTGRSCSGLAVGLGQGDSHVHRSTTGAASTSSTSLATACMAGATGCSVSGDALASQGSADSAGGHQSSGSLADLVLGGTGAGAPGDPITLSVPMGCGTGTQVLCAALDQNLQGAGASGAGTQQTVLSLGTLGDVLGVTAAQTATGAHVVSAPTSSGGGSIPHITSTTGTGPHAGSIGSDETVTGSGTLTSATAGQLPHTGGPWGGAVPLALLLIAIGGLGVARSWRREVG